MSGIEILELLPGDLSVALIKTTVKEKQHIADIIKNYGIRLQGFIRKRVQNSEDADDILQEVYYQLADADRLLKPIDQMAAWLFTVARNRITDLYRKKKTESLPEIFTETDDEGIFTELRNLMFDDGSTPEDDYLRSLVWTELDKALDELPEEQHEVFELTELKGLSFKEISKQTGVQVNTLISRKRYAVLVLRERLQLIYDELLNF
ncbi:MAG: sigma-70 family RNA polymerase sigma factor [Bacteroidota bacterium]|nr:RNA polymerase subunit sigma-24 [Odoribacter sp.]MDP3644048.1 sigma-70 family RNA polymerase sigma factor [Bacteroidota bacterium]